MSIFVNFLIFFLYSVTKLDYIYRRSDTEWKDITNAVIQKKMCWGCNTYKRVGTAIENLTIFVIYSSNNCTSPVSILNAGIISPKVQKKYGTCVHHRLSCNRRVWSLRPFLDYILRGRFQKLWIRASRKKKNLNILWKYGRQ